MTYNHPLFPLLHRLLDDMQAMDVVIIDVQEQTTITDAMIICTGRSSRHVKAIGSQVMEQLKQANAPVLSSHGLEQGDWVLLDFGDFILHVMQKETRAFYNLEGLWQSRA